MFRAKHKLIFLFFLLRMAALKYFVVAFAACIGMALANSAGAPIDACQDLTPQHGVDAQKSAYPYSLNAAANKVTRGKEITVTLRGNGPQDKIKGFLIQARDGTLPIGQFRVVDRTKSQLLQCSSQGVSEGVNDMKRRWLLICFNVSYRTPSPTRRLSVT